MIRFEALMPLMESVKPLSITPRKPPWTDVLQAPVLPLSHSAALARDLRQEANRHQTSKAVTKSGETKPVTKPISPITKPQGETKPETKPAVTKTTGESLAVRKPGRPRIGAEPMSVAERNRNYRARKARAVKETL